MDDRDLKRAPGMVPMVGDVNRDRDGANAHGIGPDTDGGHATKTTGQEPLPPRIGWVVEEQPLTEQLRFLIEREELTAQQRKEAAARVMLDAAARQEQIGDQRRRWIINATAARIFRDSGGLVDGAAVFEQFTGLIPDNRELAAKKDSEAIRVMLQRDGWADIAIEWKPALDQASDAAEPVDEWASVENKTARPWLVFTKSSSKYADNREAVFTNGNPERFETFGAAVVAARSIGKGISQRASMMQDDGYKVRFL